MEFRVLGPLEVSDGGRAVALGGVKQRSLLAILLQRPNAIVSADHLLAELWGDAPPSSAANSIHVHISRLRKELGPDRVITRPPGYALRVGPSELDLAAFERLRAEGRLREALALWRGPAYDDLAYEPCVQAERARLEELRLATLEERIDADLAAGRHADLVGELESAIAEHPLRERLRGQLMLALYRSARQAEALAAYRAARRELAGELGLEPGGELRRLERAILRQDPALDPPVRGAGGGLAAGRPVVDRTARRPAGAGHVAGGAAGARVRRARRTRWVRRRPRSRPGRTRSPTLVRRRSRRPSPVPTSRGSPSGKGASCRCWARRWRARRAWCSMRRAAMSAC